jgi:HPt (histidine-containing phosphotransfer) domain-containing protein
MGKTEAEQERIYEIGLMHDIGKIGVSEEIINKPSKLTDEEFAKIKKHTVIGYNILSPVTEIPELAECARSHHERYDGTGYPDGLKGKDIPETARIICVADCYDAMTSTRTYSPLLPQETVHAEIERCSGTQFDPDIAAIMLQMIDDDKQYRMNEQGGLTVWENKNRLWGGQTASREEAGLPEWLGNIAEIDTQSGITHCGGEETYLETLTIYAGSVAENADEIEGYLRDGDTKNATIKIHALKSTSRVIGAGDLGALAEKLEKAGNNNDIDTINANIDELLTRYRALGDALSPLNGSGPGEGLPLISEDELSEIYTGISEFMSFADYDSAVMLIDNLKSYSFPENEKERCEALIKAADEIQYEMIPEILKKGE